MKKYLLVCTVILVILLGEHHYGYVVRNYLNTSITNSIKQVSRVNEDSFEVYVNHKWETIFLKGVNMGTAKPGYFPGEFGITKDDYLRWFDQIGEMNANVIRVYTLQSPAFYEALEEHNRYANKPLYIMHGVWLKEETMLEEMNAFSPEVLATFSQAICEVIDAIHGNLNIDERVGEAYGNYSNDISPYVIGFILGTEWDPYFVDETNKINEGIEEFKGEYVYTEKATPTENFFAQMIEHAVSYETEKYQMQRPVAMTNWVTTDIINHEKDLEEDNMLANIDVETIHSTNRFQGNLFVSYHVYPYYPDFLNYDSEYADFVDESGQKNSYVAYLKKLKSYHSLPVVISEFGVPTSRGLTHIDLARGFNQGMITENQQADMDVTMLNEIYDEGYAGAIVFTWQDEWFKRTWNTMDFDDPSARPYWSDKMTNEKYFGLLSFDSGKESSQIYLDGEINDWKKRDLLNSNDEMELYTRSDESYIYLRIHKEDLNLEQEELIIPIDVTPNSGTTTIPGYSMDLNTEADFYIHIGQSEKATLYVQDYYDASEYANNPLENFASNSQQFNVYTQVVLGESVNPETGEVIPVQKVEVGQLIQGNSNPEDINYNSLSDYYIGDNEIEIRIPWLMLNVSNPAEKTVLGDFYKTNEFSQLSIDNIYIGCYAVENQQTSGLEMAPYSWDKWELPTYRERLKPAYYSLKEAFDKLN